MLVNIDDLREALDQSASQREAAKNAVDEAIKQLDTESPCLRSQDFKDFYPNKGRWTRALKTFGEFRTPPGRTAPLPRTKENRPSLDKIRELLSQSPTDFSQLRTELQRQQEALLDVQTRSVSLATAFPASKPFTSSDPLTVSSAMAERTLSTLIALFAALVGFGLKQLLDPNHGVRDAHWPAFVVAVLLFSRFLVGAANHLRAEHLNDERSRVSLIAFDLGFLIVFGICAALISYSETSEAFFGRTIFFMALTLAWNFLDSRFIRRETSSVSFGWLLINAGQMLAMIIALLIHHQGFQMIGLPVMQADVVACWPHCFHQIRTPGEWVVLMPLQVVFLFFDFRNQAKYLGG